MTAIIGFSGKKTSGKNTCCNFILGNCLNSLGIVRGLFSITDEGQLYVSDVFGDESQGGLINMNRDNPTVNEFWEKNIDPYVKIYSFADALKDICINILGLSKELVYGTNEQKETLTNLMWEDMAGVVTPERMKVFNNIYDTESIYEEDKNADISAIFHVFIHPAGRMTVREVMQYVGTDIFRKMYQSVWIDTLMRKIEKDGSQLALICDVRFPGEVESISAKEGITVRLTRNMFPDNTHKSETALDKYENFDYVIDNQNITIPELNSAVYEILKETGMVTEEVVA